MPQSMLKAPKATISTQSTWHTRPKQLMRVMLIVLVSGICGGCPSDGAPSKPKVTPEGSSQQNRVNDSKPTKLKPMVTQGELEVIEAKLMAEVKALEALPCARPVLRGEATPGAGDWALGAALLAEAYPACKEGLASEKEALKDAVFIKTATNPGSSNSSTSMHASRVRDLSTPIPPRLVKLIEACEPALGEVTEAIQHEKVCSPWRPGLRHAPEEGLSGIIGLGTIASLKMRALWQAGQIDRAMALGVDMVRASQDLTRGGATLLEAMISHAAEQGPIATLAAILNAPKPISTPTLDVLDANLEILTKTEPDFHQILRSDQLQLHLYTIFPTVKDDTWEPPGGWGPEGKPKKNDQAHGTLLLGDLEQERALTVAAAVEVSEDIVASCPADSTIETCANSMNAAVEQATAAAEAIKDTQGMLLKAFKNGHNPQFIRKQVTAILRGVAMPNFGAYLMRFASRRFSATALRVHVSARRIWENSRRCPTAAMLRHQLDPNLVDPLTNKPMRISKSADSVLLAPAMTPKHKDKRSQEHRITCPIKKVGVQK